jgi:hypothetical protein
MPAAAEMVGRIVVAVENFVVVHIAELVDSTAEQQVHSIVVRQERPHLNP